jgi:phosphoadenosine phosphosulfate reductase
MFQKPPPKASEVHNKPSKDFAVKLAQTQELLSRAAQEFSPCVQASSLGAEDMVITALIQKLELSIDIFVLDTGALHTETLALLERVQSRASSRSKVLVYKPELQNVIEFIRREGQDAMYKSQALRKECCQIRKLEPLARALTGQKAWITGLRAEQSNNRAQMQWIEEDFQAGSPITKFNPLMQWTWGDVWHFLSENGVDYNPLHDQFYPSIGCAPCTRAISLGEDFRAGRWWWEEATAKECGLHQK